MKRLLSEAKRTPSVELDVSYGLIAVFDSQLEKPYNDWEDAHVVQGFSWRPGSVSFATVESNGPISVQISRTAESLRDPETSMRTIRVPFTVPEHGELEVSRIGNSVVFEMDACEYALTFQHGAEGADGMWAVFVFEAVEAPVDPEILQFNGPMSRTAEFLMTARPA